MLRINWTGEGHWRIWDEETVTHDHLDSVRLFAPVQLVTERVNATYARGWAEVMPPVSITVNDNIATIEVSG